MKTRSLVVLIILSSFFISVKAQLADEIKSYVDSTEILFNNGRKMLSQALTESDYLKAGKIYFYLKDESSKRNCAAFNYWEEQCIMALLSDWQKWFENAEKINERTLLPTCYNYSDALSDRLYKLVFSNIKKINEETATLEINIEQKDLLDLYLHYIIKGDDNEEYKIKAKSYKKKYKENSRYYTFFTTYFPPVKPEISWGIAVGSTFMTPDDVLGSMFKSGTMINFSYEFNLGGIYTSLFMNGGSLPVKAPFYFTDGETSENISFDVGDSFSYINAGLAAGFFLVKGKHFKLAPYFAIGGYTIESNLYPEYSTEPEIQVVNSFFYGPGVHTEFKITEFEVKPNPFWYGGFGMHGANSKSYISIKLDAGYDIINKHNFTGITGNSSYVKLGLVWGLGGF